MRKISFEVCVIERNSSYVTTFVCQAKIMKNILYIIERIIEFIIIRKIHNKIMKNNKTRKNANISGR